MSKPINQHWVPRFYLKYFSVPESLVTDQPKTWVFYKDHNKGDPFFTNIKNICTQRYLYSPSDGSNERDWALESKLCDLEGLLSNIWPSIAEGFIDLESESIRKAISLFMATLILRHPSYIDVTSNIHKQLLDIFKQAPHDGNGTPLINNIEINGKKVLIDTSDWVAFSNQSKLDDHKLFVSLIESEAAQLAQTLMQKRWSVISSKTPVFITSDNPVSKKHLTRKTFGFGTKGTIVTFPLSPTKLLVLDDEESEPPNQYYNLSSNGSAPHNFLIWQGGEYMISHRHPDEVLNEFINMDIMSLELNIGAI